MVPLSYYEIRVAGVLPSEVLRDFDRLTASVEPVETVVHGPLQDQAALHGLLSRLETFAVQVTEVRRLHDTAVPPTVSAAAPEGRCARLGQRERDWHGSPSWCAMR
jgi:hypothetical protein